ncbi:MAG: magnesium chelatase, partial [Corynebacterium glutamicum]|nr:magnesium chelatase [Corynebacterium glutamicum]
GKIEFESGEEGREWEILDYLLRTATAEALRSTLRSLDLTPLIAALDGSITVSTGTNITASEFLASLPELGESTLYDDIAQAFGATTPSTRAMAIELALEGLYLSRKIAKDSGEGETIYG